MGILGGIGSPYGALLGAVIFTWVSDSLSHVWAHWPMLLGLLFCAVVLTMRGGVVEILHFLGPSTSARFARLLGMTR